MLCAAQNFTDLSFEQAKNKAADEKKIILVDVMTPKMQNDAKKQTEKLVASGEGVAEFCSNNIIAVRMDMSTEEGKAFAPLLQMNMYPVYAFMMPDGDLLAVVSPYLLSKNPEIFIEKAKSALTAAKEKWNNSRHINFQEISFQKAMEMAKNDNKLIFIDAVTENCQPCMMMSKNIFTLDKVADFYNEHFICLSMNLGTENKDLATKYNAFAFPTFLFIKADGELVLSESGYCDASKFIGYGQNALLKNNINFEHGSWNEIVALAKKEKKPIFLDCYTTWCGPCKQMTNTVFTRPEVAEYFNTTFINAKFDMEKGEGIQLKNNFNVSAYPTYLYIDYSGIILNRLVGSMPADEFIKESKEGLSENGLAGMQKKYADGQRDDEFVLSYLNVLEKANMKKEAGSVAKELFKTTDVSNFLKKEYFSYFLEYEEDVDSGLFKYIYKNREKLYTIYPKNVVDMKLHSIWEVGSQKYITGNGENAIVDNKGLKEYAGRMKREGVEDYKNIEENARLFNAIQSFAWKDVTLIIDKKIKKVGMENISERELLGWGLQIDRFCKDSEIRAHAAEWFKEFIPIYEAKETKRKEEAAKRGAILAMSMINFQKEFQKVYESLTTKK